MKCDGYLDLFFPFSFFPPFFYACILLKIYNPDDINLNYCLLKTSIENKLSCEAADLESVSLSLCVSNPLVLNLFYRYSCVSVPLNEGKALS